MAKNNEKIWRWSKILLALILVFAGVVYGYGRLNGRVESLETQAVEAKDTRERVIRIEEGVEHLKKAVDRIEKKIDR